MRLYVFYYPSKRFERIHLEVLTFLGCWCEKKEKRKRLELRGEDG